VIQLSFKKKHQRSAVTSSADVNKAQDLDNDWLAGTSADPAYFGKSKKDSVKKKKNK